MKIFLLLIIILFSLTHTQAQNISVDILQQGNSFADSSYYDIIKVENKYWIGGKYGILKALDSDGRIENISYPSEGLDIYKLENFDDETVLASGDKGTLYIHSLKTKTWKTIKVKNYENACFYNLAVDSQKKHLFEWWKFQNSSFRKKYSKWLCSCIVRHGKYLETNLPQHSQHGLVC